MDDTWPDGRTDSVFFKPNLTSADILSLSEEEYEKIGYCDLRNVVVTREVIWCITNSEN